MGRKSFRLSVLEECIEVTLEDALSHDFYCEMFDVIGYFSQPVLGVMRPSFTSVVHAASIVEVFHQRHPYFRQGLQHIIWQSEREIAGIMVAFSDWVTKNENRGRVGAKCSYEHIASIAEMLLSTEVEDWHRFSAFVFCSIAGLPEGSMPSPILSLSKTRHSSLRLEGSVTKTTSKEVING